MASKEFDITVKLDWSQLEILTTKIRELALLAAKHEETEIDLRHQLEKAKQRIAELEGTPTIKHSTLADSKIKQWAADAPKVESR